MPIRRVHSGSELFGERRAPPGARCAWCVSPFTAEYPVVQFRQGEGERLFHDHCAAVAFPGYVVYEHARGRRDAPARRPAALWRLVRRLLPRRWRRA